MTYILKILGIIIGIIIVGLLLSLFELFTQLARYQAYWNKNNQKPAQTNELLYVALGDSTAQGIGATNPQKGYVGLVAKEIEHQQQRPVRLVNLSKSGAKVSDVLENQVPAMEKLGIAPDTIITIEIGANNMINFQAEQFEKEMDQLMSKLPKQTLISDIPYFGGSRFKSREPNVRQANQIMYRLADKYGFQLVPLHDRIQQNSGLETFAADLFHPSNKAYRENWAKVFTDRL